MSNETPIVVMEADEIIMDAEEDKHPIQKFWEEAVVPNGKKIIKVGIGVVAVVGAVAGIAKLIASAPDESVEIIEDPDQKRFEVRFVEDQPDYDPSDYEDKEDETKSED